MKLKVTQKNARANGKLIEKGTVLNIKGDAIPASLVGKVMVLDGEENTAIINPENGGQAKTYAVVEKSAGWFAVTHGDKEVTKSLRKDAVEGFDALSDEDKAKFVEANKAE